MMENSYQELLEEIKTFCDERDWERFHDGKNLALSLLLEASEVLELFQWTKNNEINPEKVNDLPDELADVFYWLIKIADKYDIDLFDALKKKMQKNYAKYPVDKVKSKSNKYTDL